MATADNGNVASITNNINSARTQTFTYDELNRVSTAKTQATSGTYAWGLSFGYDAWAYLLNATVIQGSAPPLRGRTSGALNQPQSKSQAIHFYLPRVYAFLFSDI